MKKTYISPNIITVKLSARRQIMLTGSPFNEDFIEEDATGDAMTKGVINNKSIWDEEW